MSMELMGRTADNLSFMRRVMQRSGTVTRLPGGAHILMGFTAINAAVLAALTTSPASWLTVWLAEAVLAAVIGFVGLWRAAIDADGSLWHGPARRFVIALAPSLVAGGLLTAALYGAGSRELLPGTWLVLYGSGVCVAGQFSVAHVTRMGLVFMLAGALAFMAPAGWMDVSMAIGFGGLHIIFGAVYIACHDNQEQDQE